GGEVGLVVEVAILANQAAFGNRLCSIGERDVFGDWQLKAVAIELELTGLLASNSSYITQSSDVCSIALAKANQEHTTGSYCALWVKQQGLLWLCAPVAFFDQTCQSAWQCLTFP